MAKGFEIQMPLIARLRNERKIKVETLEASGRWFKANYKITPATSVTVNTDLPGSDRKTVWFNSRFYRANLLWENSTLRFRDIHLFDEKLPSVYETQQATDNECTFFTLPVVDGYLWSNAKLLAGLRFKVMVDGKEVALEGNAPAIISPAAGKLHISWPLKNIPGKLLIDLDERGIAMKINSQKAVNWFLDLSAAEGVKLPFVKVGPQRVDCKFEGLNYTLRASKGSFLTSGGGGVFKITSENNSLNLNFTGAE
jgi:hypothetical protein